MSTTPITYNGQVLNAGSFNQLVPITQEAMRNISVNEINTLGIYASGAATGSFYNKAPNLFSEAYNLSGGYFGTVNLGSTTATWSGGALGSTYLNNLITSGNSFSVNNSVNGGSEWYGVACAATNNIYLIQFTVTNPNDNHYRVLSGNSAIMQSGIIGNPTTLNPALYFASGATFAVETGSAWGTGARNITSSGNNATPKTGSIFNFTAAISGTTTNAGSWFNLGNVFAAISGNNSTNIVINLPLPISGLVTDTMLVRGGLEGDLGSQSITYRLESGTTTYTGFALNTKNTIGSFGTDNPTKLVINMSIPFTAVLGGSRYPSLRQEAFGVWQSGAY